MKKIIAALALLALAAPAQATVYNDSTGDTFFGGILDIVSVEVTDDAVDLTFKMTVVGDMSAPNDWGNYMYHINTNSSTGDTNAPVGNPWNRPISYQPDGADYWLGAWVNGGGGWQHWSYSGGWGQNFQTGLTSLNAFDFTIKTSLASLGLSPGDSFCFDAYSSGAQGDPGAIDSLGNPNQQINDWNEASNAHPVCYTTTPEPGSLALLAIGALAMLRRRR